jgi:hypothetical protein
MDNTVQLEAQEHLNAELVISVQILQLKLYALLVLIVRLASLLLLYAQLVLFVRLLECHIQLIVQLDIIAQHPQVQLYVQLDTSVQMLITAPLLYPLHMIKFQQFNLILI